METSDTRIGPNKQSNHKHDDHYKTNHSNRSSNPIREKPTPHIGPQTPRKAGLEEVVLYLPKSTYPDNNNSYYNEDSCNNNCNNMNNTSAIKSSIQTIFVNIPVLRAVKVSR